MAYVPTDARRFLADVVLEHRIEDEPRNVVHVNTLLVEATSAEDAFTKAVLLGHAEEVEYRNTDGKLVHVTFRGLRELNVIHDDLEHGAELCFSESVDVSEATLAKWIRSKEQLGVFAPIENRGGGPNYMPESVMALLQEKLKG